MKKLTDTSRVSGVMTIGYLAIATLSSIFITAPHAGALSLPSVWVDLPLQGTVLAPVTTTVNTVTDALPMPITVQNTPSTIGASVDTGLTPSTDGTQPAQASIDIPLPQPVTDAVRQVAPEPQPSAAPVASSSPTRTNGQRLRPAVTYAPANTTTPTTKDTDDTTADAKPAIITTTASHKIVDSDMSASDKAAATGPSFLLSLPPAIRQTAATLKSPTTDARPIILSAAIFVATLGIIFGILFLANTSRFTTADTRVARLVASWDVAQMSILIIATISAGAIAIYLALTVL